MDTEIKKYIDETTTIAADKAVRKARKDFQADSERYMGALKEGFQDQMKLLTELVGSKPSEERVREIVHEEIEPLKSDISVIKFEIKDMNKEMRGMKEEMRQHNAEMKQLRKDSNSHGKRLTRLENVLV